MSNASMSHQIAAKAATQMVRECMAAGLTWTDIAIACETSVAICVAAAAELSGTPDRLRFATEITDNLTERAHGRVAALIQGVPYEG